MPRQHPREDGGFSVQGEKQHHPGDFLLQKMWVDNFHLGLVFGLSFKNKQTKREREREKKERKILYPSIAKGVGLGRNKPRAGSCPVRNEG